MPLALVIPPQIFLAHLQLSELYMAWLHTEVVDNIGPLEFILNTPSHHRVHHGRNPEYIDKNYGGMLIIWDRMFNTFKAEDKTIPAVYGLVHPIKNFNPIKVQFHPWPILWRRLNRLGSFKQQLRAIFYGPGWNPTSHSRLGDSNKIPKIVHPVESYDPDLSGWKKTYIVAHFGLLLLFYHHLTFYQDKFGSVLINTGVLCLLVSITTLGMMLNADKAYGSRYELIRCLLFFQARQHLIQIIDHGLVLDLGASFYYRKMIILGIQLFFGLSAIVNSIGLAAEFLSTNGYKIKHLRLPNHNTLSEVLSWSNRKAK